MAPSFPPVENNLELVHKCLQRYNCVSQSTLHWWREFIASVRLLSLLEQNHNGFLFCPSSLKILRQVLLLLLGVKGKAELRRASEDVWICHQCLTWLICDGEISGWGDCSLSSQTYSPVLRAPVLLSFCIRNPLFHVLNLATFLWFPLLMCSH